MIKRFVEWLLTPKRRKHPMTNWEIDIRNAPRPNPKWLDGTVEVNPDNVLTKEQSEAIKKWVTSKQSKFPL